jgi:hypothetical protein
MGPHQVTSIVTRKQAWRTLLEEVGRPGFCFKVDYHDPDAKPPPPLPRDKQPTVAESIEHRWQSYTRLCERVAWLDDDTVPCLNMMTGTEIFAEAFGCPVHRPADSNPFALPLIHGPGEVAALRVPDLGSSTLARHFEIADELHRRAGPDAIFHMVDVQSPMDIAALIMEKSAFYTAMIEAAEAVKELAAKVHQLLTAFLDEWFRRYGTDYLAHFPDYFMSGGMTLSEDEVGAVNADMFEEFFMSELAALSSRYGGIGIHCCADARHQWAHFRRVPGLRLLNFCNPPMRDPACYIKEAYAFFKDCCAQWHMGWTPDGPIETWPAQFPPGCRVVVTAATDKREDAIRLCARLQERRANPLGAVAPC